MKQDNIKITRRIHHGWGEFKILSPKFSGKAKKILRNHFGKWQYLITNGKRTISLIELKKYEMALEPRECGDIDIWEYAELKGNKVKELGRAYSKEEAMAKIRKILK